MYAVIHNGKVVKEHPPGRPYKNISFSVNSPDSDYIAAGLLPINEQAQPSFNKFEQKLTLEYVINAQSVDKTYVVESLPPGQVTQKYSDVKAEYKAELTQKALIQIMSQADPNFASAISQMDAVTNDANIEASLQSILDNWS